LFAPSEKPATPPAPAAEKPAAETPAALPATPPTPPPPKTDDLFGPSPKAAMPAEKPAEEPAATPPAPLDDLFGPTTKSSAPAAKPATPPAPAAEKSVTPSAKPAGNEKKEEKKKDDTDIFGASPTVLHEAGGLASSEMRTWVDNTGNFSCQARMIRLVDGQVRLLKDNGHTATLPLARLSTGDIRFVERQADAQQAAVFQTAQSVSALPFAN
jgi:SLA1 homology domain 1, SHD1